MSVVWIVVCVIVSVKCVMAAIRVREKCFMHRKEKLVRFMTVLETVNVCNCGECSDVPCKIWFDTRDPIFSDEEFSENVTMRVQTLKKE